MLPSFGYLLPKAVILKRSIVLEALWMDSRSLLKLETGSGRQLSEATPRLSTTSQRCALLVTGGWDYREAEKWWRILAEKGNSKAQVHLAWLYADTRFLHNGGVGVMEDFAEAARWYLRAAKQGNRQAQVEIGSMYSAGRALLGIEFKHICGSTFALQQDTSGAALGAQGYGTICPPNRLTWRNGGA